MARVGWVILVVPPLMLFITQIPSYFAALHLLRSSNAQAFSGQLTLHDVQALQALGLSLDFYATCMVGVSLLFQLSYATMGVLLFCRKPDDRMALQASFALMLSPFGFAYLTLQTLPAGWSWLIPTLSFLGNASIMICAYVFPNGKFVPRWTRWLALVLIGYWAGVAIFPSLVLTRFWLNFALFFVLALSTMLVQVYRYRYIATGKQRQQTKWIVFGISVAVAGNVGARFLASFVLLPPPGGSSLADVVEVIIITFSMLVIPFTLGIAILSSRLWDIDVLINRTLVYGSLTAILALVYFGIIIVLQPLVSGLTGQFSAVSHSPLVLVVSTLGIAALFQPLRHHIQAIIDRRFYRRKYDAVRILGTFRVALRNEVDLNQVSEQLVEVVQETMQPTYVSLWLLTLERPKERKTRLLPIIDE
jgi:hypothetical protein